MKGSDIDRLTDLRRLYDRVVDKLANVKDPHQKQQQALKLMDKLLGAEWRSEVKAYPEYEVFEIHIIDDGPPVKDPEKFYNRVSRMLAKFGLDAKDPGELPPPVIEENKNCDCLLCRVERLEQLVGTR